MSGPRVKDERLYEPYTLWRGEYCSICEVLESRSFVGKRGEGYLCPEHFDLYAAEVEKIKAGEERFPPGLNKKTQEVFLLDETLWMYIRILEVLCHIRHRITEEKAREQMKAIIDLYNDGCETPKERQQRIRQMEEESNKRMLPKSRLY